MLVNYTYKYRIYPNEKQKEIFAKHFGCCRFVYNYFLNQQKEYYFNNKEDIEAKRIKGFSAAFDNQKLLTQLKKQDDYKWLNEVSSHSLGISLKNLETAYSRFFKKIGGFPKFKKKSYAESYQVDNLTLYIKNGKVYVPKIKDGVKIKEHRKLEGKILNGTISRTSSGKFFVSITVEKEISYDIPYTDKAIGIDLGIKDFCVDNNGVKYENPKFKKKYENKLKYLNKQLSKKKINSSNRNKTRIRLANIYEKINNCKKDYLNKLSNKLTNENQVICLEDLRIQDMLKNHKLAENIQNCSWYEFKRQLKYKSGFKGHIISTIDRYFPSSKTCYDCGYIKEDLKLSDREWICPKCGCVHDRDVNASKNILKQGLNLIDNL